MGILQQNNPFKLFYYSHFGEISQPREERKEKKRWEKVPEYKVVCKYTSK